MLKDPDAGVRAVLGPTNTGKTHYAIERMLAHRSGVIGLPLRLLAREVYDRIVAQRGPSVVALVTGEERIVPDRAAYWVATVEAMPLNIGAEFVAVDEIQLCADPERGHIFTDRLLNARGLSETLFLGSDTMKSRLFDLIPRVDMIRRERLSDLRYAGSKKVSRMPARSAIVGFSVEDVYALAEVIRRLKGGAAVVMGALSPRTRNAQVALYQNGDVDYLIATDAIGMGLNLDIDHVAFSGLVKFDGRRTRALMPHELGQIAGRAGRFRNNGSFGVTGDAAPLDADLVQAIEAHSYAPIKRLVWRNRDLEFGSVGRLVASLEAASTHETLMRAREADDLAALKSLAAMPEVAQVARQGPEVRLLWDVCQVPDFRNVSPGAHAALLSRVFGYLVEDGGRIPADWMAKQISRIDKTTGDIDTLSKRLAYVRTWTYVAQRKNWVEDALSWREETRQVEDRLSDALHLALTQRFVDRRTSVLMRRLKQRESLVAEVTKDGTVTVDGEFVGRLEGFRFQLDPKADGDQAKTLRAAGLAALQPEFNLRADRMYNAPDAEFDLTEQGGLMWGDAAVGKLGKGADALSPVVEVFVDEEAGADVAGKVARRLGHWIDRRIAAQFEPLLAMKDDEVLLGLPRGVAFQLVEALGVIPRGQIAEDIKNLDQDGRGLLRKHGVRFGQFTIFMPQMLKPAPTRLRLVLASLAEGAEEFPVAPPPGLVTIPAPAGLGADYFARSGYRRAGDRAIRIDMLERLADMIRAEDTRGGFEAKADMLSITGLTLEQFANLMEGLGYRADRGEREKVRPARAEAAPQASDTEPETAADTPNAAVPAEKNMEQSAEPDAGEAPANAPTPEETTDGPEPTAAVADAAPGESDAPSAGSENEAGEPALTDEPVVEVFYTFRWAGRKTGRSRPPRSEKPKGPRRKGGKPNASRPPRKSSAPAPRKERPIDPDNPFAALMALKEKG